MKVPKISFHFDRERDIWNIWDKSNSKSSYGQDQFKVRKDLRNICEGRSLRECREELTSYLAPLHNSSLLRLYIESVKRGWRLIEKEYFRRANQIFQAELPRNPQAYLTTIGTCPYNVGDSSFMFSFFYPLADSLRTCGHELFHLYFHNNYWSQVENQVGKKKTSDLKEALTVLLNTDFKDLWFSEDRGYTNHVELRKFIEERWREKKDFPHLLKECVVYLR